MKSYFNKNKESSSKKKKRLSKKTSLSTEQKHSFAQSKQAKKHKHFPLYDQLFKDVYSYKEYALELLKATLSEGELSILHLSNTRLEKESFSKGLRGDLVFTIPLKDHPYLRVPFVILFEHKSVFNYDVLFQVLRYMVEVIEFYSKKVGKKIMPPMIAILFSHGKKVIKTPLQLQDLLPKEWLEAMDKEGGKGPFSSLSRDMLNYRLRGYNVHDPSRYKEWENLGSRMALELFKNKKLLKSKDESVLEKELLLLFEGLKGVQNQDILLSAVQYHLFQRNSKIDLGFFNRCLKKASDKDRKLLKVKGGKMGAYVPMLERGMLEGLQKGRQEGKQEGRQEGKQEGRQEGRQEVALNLLKTTDMDIQAISKATGLSKQDVLNLKKSRS